MLSISGQRISKTGEAASSDIDQRTKRDTRTTGHRFKNSRPILKRRSQAAGKIDYSDWPRVWKLRRVIQTWISSDVKISGRYYVAESGVGTTRFAEGFVRSAIVDGQVPGCVFADVLSTSFQILVLYWAGTKYRGDFRKRLKSTFWGELKNCRMRFVVLIESPYHYWRCAGFWWG